MRAKRKTPTEIPTPIPMFFAVESAFWGGDDAGVAVDDGTVANGGVAADCSIAVDDGADERTTVGAEGSITVTVTNFALP